MTPLGMAVSLQQDENPNGRIYLSGYGNSVSYYEESASPFLRQAIRRTFPGILPGSCWEKIAPIPRSPPYSRVGFEQAQTLPQTSRLSFAVTAYFREMLKREIDAWNG